MEKNPSSEVINLNELGMQHPIYQEIFTQRPYMNFTKDHYGFTYEYDGGEWKAFIVDQKKYTLFLLSRQ